MVKSCPILAHNMGIIKKPVFGSTYDADLTVPCGLGFIPNKNQSSYLAFVGPGRIVANFLPLSFERKVTGITAVIARNSESPV